MSVDFDFDTSFNDDDEEEEGIDNIPKEDDEADDGEDFAFADVEEFASEEETMEDMDEEGEEVEETGNRSNLLRLILLVLFMLVALCGVCYLGYRFLPFGDIASSPPADTAPVAEDTAAPAPTDSVVSDTDQAADAATGQTEAAAETDSQSGTDQEAADAAAGESEDDAAATEGDAVVGDAQGEGDAAAGDAQGEGSAEGEGDAAAGGAQGEGSAEGEGDATAGGAQGEGDAEEGAAEGDDVSEDAMTAEGSEEDAAAEADSAVCENNVPPVAEANGPYQATIGKGQALILFDSTGSYDPNGSIANYSWDFGDGSTPGSGEAVQYGYISMGIYEVALTVTDNCGDVSIDIAEVTILAAETPDEEEEAGETGEARDEAMDSAESGAEGEADSAAEDEAEGDADDDAEQSDTTAESDYVAPAVEPGQGTLGFCYLVQRGDTLWGIATAYGVSLYDLAYVNSVSPHYHVIAGQGLFVPTGDILPQGPNIIQVDPGDTLYSIAAQCGAPVARLARMNGLNVDSPLNPGQVIAIPPPWSY